MSSFEFWATAHTVISGIQEILVDKCRRPFAPEIPGVWSEIPSFGFRGTGHDSSR
ncbi:hypothetical protein V5O48_017607, partial [Marasmius crinis-equi]